MNKKDKRNNNYKHFEEELEQNINFKKFVKQNNDKV
jgi:hypothetical protein